MSTEKSIDPRQLAQDGHRLMREGRPDAAKKLFIQVLAATSGLGAGMATAAQRHMVSVLNRAVFVDQRDISGELQRPAIGDQCFIRDFKQSRGALILLAFREPPVKRFRSG